MTKPGPTIDYLSKDQREKPLGWAYAISLALDVLSLGCTFALGSFVWQDRRSDVSFLRLVPDFMLVMFQFLIFSCPGLVYLNTHRIGRRAEYLLSIAIIVPPLISIAVIIVEAIVDLMTQK
jgi:hypothetical protein